MNNHEDLILRLYHSTECMAHLPCSDMELWNEHSNAVLEAAAAIRMLVEERNHWEDDALQRAANTGYWRDRAEKAEAAWDKWRSLGTVQNFLACDDDTKIACFRQGLQESERRKKAEADLAAARAALRYMVDRDHPAAWLNYPNRYEAAIEAARKENTHD